MMAGLIGGPMDTLSAMVLGDRVDAQHMATWVRETPDDQVAFNRSGMPTPSAFPKALASWGLDNADFMRLCDHKP